MRTVAYQRLRVEDQPVARVRRNVFGITGALQQQWDPRLHALQGHSPGGRPAISRQYSLSGRVLRTDSVDAGWHIVLSGSGGQGLTRWDSRGSWQRHQYDGLLRRVAVFEQAGNDVRERCVERLAYAPTSAGHAAFNRCGRLVRHDDPAGSVTIEHYGLGGVMTGQSRRLLKADTPPDWPAAEHLRELQLAPERFASSWHYDALGGLQQLTDARSNQRLWRYGVEGELARVELVFSSARRKVLLERRDCNAQGQVTREQMGNGMLAEFSYDEKDGSLLRLAAYRSARRENALQDMTYAYDRVGNVLSIRDAAQPTTWHSNVRSDATCVYGYDSLYQLINASGRENAWHAGGPALPGLVVFGAAQADLWRNYSRHYQYDAGGNLVQMRHVPSSGQGYTRRMAVAAHSNHAWIQGQAVGFDRCGNQQTLTAGQALSWNLRNQLAQVSQVLRDDGQADTESYAYDAHGQRLLKRRVSKAAGTTHLREVIYLPGLELRRDHATGQWLNVLTVETGRTSIRALQWQKGRPAGVNDEQLRFTLSDLTGSCTLELDEQAVLLSQEGFYPYGETAWWAAKNAVEASYKTLRYSGKERDASGLYYYGLRYYAPWLQRWISPDPAAEVDGLNLYAMVSNNPMTLADADGRAGSTMSERVSLGLFFVGFLGLAGLALGALADMPAIGATAGALLGGVLLGLLVHEGYRNARRRAVHNSAESIAEWLSQRAIDIAESRGLTHEETHRLVNFFYEHQEDNALLSVAAHSTPEGKIYGFVGPAVSAQVANNLMQAGKPMGRDMRRLGYSNILLRDPVRAQPDQPAGPSTAGAVSTFDVQATTGLARRKVARAGAPAASSDSPGVLARAPASAFSADMSAVEHLMGGPEGRSIALTIGHLREGRTAAVHWHKHQDEGGLWSADLHAYPGGGTGRGAFRLMFEHLGGRRYRVVGVRNPHR